MKRHLQGVTCIVAVISIAAVPAVAARLPTLSQTQAVAAMKRVKASEAAGNYREPYPGPMTFSRGACEKTTRTAATCRYNVRFQARASEPSLIGYGCSRKVYVTSRAHGTPVARRVAGRCSGIVAPSR